MFPTINENNPLGKYRIANYKKSWQQIAKEAGLHPHHVMRVAKYDAPAAAKQRIESVIGLYEAFGVDFVEFVSDGKYRLEKVD